MQIEQHLNHTIMSNDKTLQPLAGMTLEEMQDAVRNYIDSAGSSLRGLRIDVNPLYLD